MSDQRPPDNKLFWFNLKRQQGKSGKPFYTNGKFAYLLEIIAFEKKDGSGDLTVWLKPKDPPAENRGYAQQPQRQAAPQQQYQRPTAPPERPAPRQSMQQYQAPNQQRPPPEGWDDAGDPGPTDDGLPF